MSEFSHSDTAKANGIDNTIPQEAQNNIIALVKAILQPVCDKTKWRCQISSGYRSPELNTHPKIKGSKDSQHMKGEASDCKFYYKDEKLGNVFLNPFHVAQEVRRLKLPFDQMILYPTFVHLSHKAKGENRGQILYHSSYKGETFNYAW